MFQVDSGLLTLEAPILFEIFGFPVSNSMLSGLLTTLFLGILCFLVVMKFKPANEKPGKFQSTIEMMVEAITTFLSQIVGDRKLAVQILPIIGTVFIYVGLSNSLLLLLPGLSGITIDGVNVFRTHTDDFSATFGLAVAMVIISHWMGIQKFGFFSHFGKYIRIKSVINGFKEGIGKGFISIIDLFVGILDIIGELAKTLSLSIRLLGNIFAGDLLLGVFMSMFAIFLPALWSGMSLFTGTIQALVFGSLAAAYFAAAVKE